MGTILNDTRKVQFFRYDLIQKAFKCNVINEKLDDKTWYVELLTF